MNMNEKTDMNPLAEQVLDRIRRQEDLLRCYISYDIEAVMKQAGVSNFSVPCGSLLPGQIEAIVRTVKHMSFSAEKITAFEQAQCASGGVAGSEINEKTMESKKVKNLYLCGEVIDSCGICGGFNLHFAFASGYLAGGSL